MYHPSLLPSPQLYDTDEDVAMEALDVLDEACEEEVSSSVDLTIHGVFACFLAPNTFSATYFKFTYVLLLCYTHTHTRAPTSPPPLSFSRLPQSYLLSLLHLNPALLHLSDKGVSFLTRFFSTRKGLARMQQLGEPSLGEL